MRIYVKVILFMTALAIAAGLVNIYFAELAVSTVIDAQISRKADGMLADFRKNFPAALVSGREYRILLALQELKVKSGAAQAGVLDAKGRVIANTNVAETGRTYSDPFTLSGLNARRPVYRRISEPRVMMDFMVPLWDEKPVTAEELILAGPHAVHERIATLRLTLPLDQELKSERDILVALLWITLLVFLAATLLAAVFVRFNLKQVGLLYEGTKKVSIGDYSVQLPVVSSDEMGGLTVSFNRMSRALAETTVSKEYLDTILENMLDPLLIAGADGVIRKANLAACRLSGWTESELKGRRIWTLLGSQEAPGLSGRLRSSGTVMEMDTWFASKRGGMTPVMFSASYIAAGVGREKEIIVVLKDITQHKKTESAVQSYVREIELVNEELDAFAYSVSHDLKEPLRGMEIFSNLLLSEYFGTLDTTAQDYLKRISGAAGRMRALIGGLLSYASLGRAKNPYQEVEIGGLVDEALKDLAHVVEEKKARIAIKGNMPVLICDPVKLRQAFFNLIDNALKYNDNPAPEIEIGAEQNASEVKFFVRDNGIGIEPRNFEQIFKIFKRLHLRDEYGGGTGAGLAIVKKIIEEHHGRIWVESEKGKGAVFYFTVSKSLSPGQ